MTKTSRYNLFAAIVVTLIHIQLVVGVSIPEWKNHDISTLKLLQIVHRHGERNVLKDNIPKTDPFRNVSEYWKEGLGQLTNHGKFRMYEMGKYLRKSYESYLGDSPREVYARSSIEPRCVESLSCMLSGLYPPEGEWQWDSEGDPELGQKWQPFPIETFMPKDEDTVLVPHKKCPKANEEHNKISDSAKVRKIIDDFKKQNISKYISDLFQDPIDSLYRGQQFWDTLKIENESGLIWPQLNGLDGNYTQHEVIESLEPLGVGSYVEDWNTDFIRTIRLGKLIEMLITNMKNKINGVKTDFDRKLYAFSTHDTIVCPLLQAFGIYNELYPPYGAAILIELHGEQGVDRNEHEVRIYYYNETLESQPYLLSNQTISFDEFESNNKKYYYDNFDKMCGINTDDNLVLSEMTFLIIGIGLGIGLFGLNILAIKFIRSRRRSVLITK